MDHSEEVRQLGADLHRLLGEMEALKQEFLTAVAEWLRPWFKDKFSEVAVMERKIAQGLGEEGLRTLNNEVERLQGQTRAIIEEEAGAEKYWWHHQQKHGIPEEQKESYRLAGFPGQPELPWRQTVAIRYAAGRLWPVLNRAGFLDRRGPTLWSDARVRWENWKRVDQPPAATAATEPYYQFSLAGLPSSLEEIMQRYEALIPKVEEKKRMIAAKNRAMARENVLDLLDTASKKK